MEAYIYTHLLALLCLALTLGWLKGADKLCETFTGHVSNSNETRRALQRNYDRACYTCRICAGVLVGLFLLDAVLRILHVL